MDQITGALVGIALVLSAVFVPMAFFGGSTGVIYRQFSITIVSAMVLSVLVALILTPALCATMLKPVAQGPATAQRRCGFFGWFNRSFDRSSDGAIERRVGGMLDAQRCAAWSIYARARRRSGAAVHAHADRLPARRGPGRAVHPGAAAGRRHAGAHAGGADAGRAALPRGREGDRRRRCSPWPASASPASGQNMGIGVRPARRTGTSAPAPARTSRRSPGARWARSRRSRDAMVFAFAPPAVLELGTATGFDVQLQDRAGARPRRADRRAQPVPRHGRAGPAPGRRAPQRPGGHAAASSSTSTTRKAGALGRLAGRHQQHAVRRLGRRLRQRLHRHAAGSRRSICRPTRPYRMTPERPRQVVRAQQRAARWCRSRAFATAHWSYGSPRLERYNGLPSLRDRRSGRAPGVSSGEAMAAMEELVAKLPPGIGFDWIGPVLPGAPVRHRRRRRSTRSRCWSCSCAWRRSTRAGRCRSR